ncbi:DNA polymerase delta subunit 3 isoform X2 [Syngnathoides biaculeatus]|uniref:DNA polymerase delta subunit 3 isoform X2 n=1 Tax=Syngnathoides biaculeatus TaxID=300417 RepID=UPI002ADD7BB8|nr:DNA polymerase delta subunit 3 isoform X2 [Syngnathoides biaculeatus]
MIAGIGSSTHATLVTYKWLSLTLGVHVNTAKQMLYHYLDHKRKESSARLHATYLVSGKFVDNGQTTHKVSLVREEQLEDLKSKMSLIVSMHVYSVQKALLRDSGPLYTVDYDIVKDNLLNCSKYSAIHCPGAVPMSSLESNSRQAPALPVPEPQQSKKPSINGDAGSESVPTKGIMGMFAGKVLAVKSQDGGKEVKADPQETAAEVDVPKGKASAKSNHLMNFFGNKKTKKQEKPVKKTEDETMQSSSSQLQQPEKKQEEKVTPEPPKNNKKDSSKTKRQESSDSEEEKMEKKKRRRIKKPASDSSEEEDVIPDSPQLTARKELSPAPSEEPISHPGLSENTKIRKRRRVLKSRTFVDDEGCIVTEKCYESESYSEDESTAPAAVQVAVKNHAGAKASVSNDKKIQKKTTENKATKQASIMGFFHRK